MALFPKKKFTAHAAKIWKCSVWSPSSSTWFVVRHVVQQIRNKAQTIHKELCTATPAKPQQTSGWFHGYPDCFTEFSLFQFFSSFQLSFFRSVLVFCLRSLISPITVCFLIIIFFYFLVPFKTLLVFFQSLCAKLNWQLASQFSSANHLSYRIVS